MTTIRITAKCSDAFWALLSENGASKGEYTGYVPRWFPNPTIQHYGDYVELVINIESGEILNWKTPSEEDLEIFEK